MSLRERFHYLLDPRYNELYQCHYNVLCHKETVQEGQIPRIVCFVTVTVIGGPPFVWATLCDIVTRYTNGHGHTVETNRPVTLIIG